MIRLVSQDSLKIATAMAIRSGIIDKSEAEDKDVCMDGQTLS